MTRFGIRREEKGGKRRGPCLCSILFALTPALILPHVTHAGSASAPMGVTVRVINNCSVSTGSLDFGAYDPTLTPATADLVASTSLSVACTRSSNPAVAVGFGNQPSGGLTTRSMSNGLERVSYEIYKDPALTQIWGESSLGSLSLGTVTSTQPITVPVHGRIPAGQTVQPGSYSDSLVVTVNF